MIGNDAVASLQALVRTYNKPLIEVHDAPLESAKLVPGQLVQAHVLAQLPNGRFQVSIQNQLLDLNLPRNTQPGDELELQVVESKGKLVLTFASDRATPAAPQAALPEEAPSVQLSASAKLVSSLLDPNADSQPALLANRQVQPSLLEGEAARLDTRDLSRQLHQSVEKSGVFYESHQKEWLAGQRSLTALRQEPQASMTQQLPNGGGDNPAPVSSVLNQTHALGAQDGTALQQLVQQQLRALDERQLLWQGQVWPQQPMEWLIRDERQGGGGGEDEGRSWSSRLTLNLPQLGPLQVNVRLDAQGVRLRFLTDREETASQIESAQSRLLEQFDAAGLTLTEARVAAHDR
ncbi:flagellar hook-length control protein FliK [Leeia sp.]|uniref:flagellar hook-length control protein FliK n=1 Tax=Leeia sp. TaxID=2884678 RepID=UPI0035B3AB09